jgi:hypothetical protein
MLKVTSLYLPSVSDCPVICNGLVTSPHPNGKVGIVKVAYCIIERTHQSEVFFENKGVEPKFVRIENLRNCQAKIRLFSVLF